MKLKYDYDVIVIGAGPAGMTAAIYLKRAGLKTLIIEKESPGGTLNKIHKLDNYPGFIDEQGSLLAFRIYSQIEQLNIDLKVEDVQKIEKEENLFNVCTNDNTYKSNYIIIATGKIPRKLEVKNSLEYESKGVSYCAICDGALYKDKDIAIIGGGNSAMQTASYMSDIANKIYIINRSNKLRADVKEQENIIDKNNIEIIYNSNVVEILGDENQIENIKLDNDKVLNVNGVFVCIGQIQNNGYYQKLNLKADDLGIIVDNNMKTSEDKVYACGDVLNKELYQVITASSEGAMAASSIIKDVKK